MDLEKIIENTKSAIKVVKEYASALIADPSLFGCLFAYSTITAGIIIEYSLTTGGNGSTGLLWKLHVGGTTVLSAMVLNMYSEVKEMCEKKGFTEDIMSNTHARHLAKVYATHYGKEQEFVKTLQQYL